MDVSHSTDSVDLPEDLVGLVKPELQPGERLLWTARSRPRPSDGARFPLTASYYAIAFIALSAGLFHAIFGPLRQRLLSVEVLVITLGMISAMIGIIAGLISIGSWIERGSARGQDISRIYALTDRRGIIWIPQKDSQAVEVHAIDRGTLRSLHRLEYPDGSGDVKFTYLTDRSYQSPSGFEGVADVRRVEDLVRRTLLDPGPNAST